MGATRDSTGPGPIPLEFTSTPPGRERFKKIKRQGIPSVTLLFSEFLGWSEGM